MQPNAELSIRLDGNQLMAQLTGQPKFPVFAESETLFFYTIVEATLEFSEGRGGLRDGGSGASGTDRHARAAKVISP